MAWLEGKIRGSEILKKMGRKQLGLDERSFDEHVNWEKNLEDRGKTKRAQYDEKGKMYFIFMIFTECTGSPIKRYYPNESEIDLLTKEASEEEISFKEKGDNFFKSLKKISIF